VSAIPEDMPLSLVVQQFAQRDALVYPVVSTGGTIQGVLTFDSLKELLADHDNWAWLVAGDVMEPVKERASALSKLSDALDEMNRAQIEAVPVLAGDGSGKTEGVLDARYARRRIREELIRRTTAV
jgi:CBS domain-containing protein